MGELKNRERLNITLSKSMAEKLRAHCEEMGYSISGVIEKGLRDYFAAPDSIKFEVLADTLTIKTYREDWTPKEIEDAYFNQSDFYETSLGLFDTKEEALAWFQKCKKKQYSRILDYPSGTVLRADVLFVREGRFDSDGEFIEGGDVWDFYAAPIE